MFQARIDDGGQRGGLTRVEVAVLLGILAFLAAFLAPYFHSSCGIGGKRISTRGALPTRLNDAIPTARGLTRLTTELERMNRCSWKADRRVGSPRTWSCC